MIALPRLRQAVLVVSDFDAAEAAIATMFGLRDPFHDPSIAHFGLQNAVFTVGDTFLEIISPVRAGTTAGRFLERTGGDGGYMAMFQLDDIAAGRARLDEAGVRIVYDGSHPDIDDLHLHPKDVGGAIVALNAARPPGSWRFAGAAWEATVPGSIAPGGLTGLVVRAADPAAMAARWAAVIGTPVLSGGDEHLGGDGSGGSGPGGSGSGSGGGSFSYGAGGNGGDGDRGPVLVLGGGCQRVRFVDAAGRPESIGGIGLALPAAVRAGRDAVTLHGVRFELSDA